MNDAAYGYMRRHALSALAIALLMAGPEARFDGSVGYVGVPHGVERDGKQLFFVHVHLHGGPAPVRRFLPNLIEQV